jgi:hypothetical protein
MTKGPVPPCLQCRHFIDDEEALICRAFPKGIPKPILLGRDHTQPYPGDNGIRFEPIQGRVKGSAK